MGPCTTSSCCCQARNLPWAPVPPPHAAARSTVSHGSLYGLPLLLSPSPHSAMCHFQVSSHCWCVPFFVIGCWRLRASHCCCQARNLPWAPVPPPHAAARSRVSHGSLYGLPLLLSPSPHSAMCHFQVSSHTAGVFHFLS
ncbi:unnamed protein product [Staurois parvus]|uniref:Uncharacterized protein n=1 Tax=Staurois parvus TaxID=386267 RepID=A0ABN9EVG4_9NEOB|nr:unnamed protein product [Staurois parvus]